MTSQCNFNVFQKMNQNDFKKTSSIASIKVNSNDLDDDEEEEKTCCGSFFRKFTIFKDLDFDIEISIDRTVFRVSDKTINMVLKYKNEMMRKYDYIDLILVSRTTITDFEDLKSLNKSNEGDSVFKKLENQQFRAFSERDFLKKPMINIKPPTPHDSDDEDGNNN